jgi:hypothetical protein
MEIDKGHPNPKLLLLVCAAWCEPFGLSLARRLFSHALSPLCIGASSNQTLLLRSLPLSASAQSVCVLII